MKTWLRIFCYLVGSGMVAAALILYAIYGVKYTQQESEENTPEKLEEKRIYVIVIIVLACSGIVLIFAAFCSTFFRVRRERRREIRRQAARIWRERPGAFHIELEGDAAAQGPNNNLPIRAARVLRRRAEVPVDEREVIGENVPAVPEPAIDQQAPNAQGVVADDLPRVDN